MSNNFIIDESFQIIRTNPRLTSNVQIVIDTNYSIYLESFNTNKQLSDDKYKHYYINKEEYYEDKIATFYDGLPINIAFEVKNDNDHDIMYNDYRYQFDDIYWSGARKVKDNVNYTEEFEYLAPLYVKKDKIPSKFIILRVDNPSIYTVSNDDYAVTYTDRTNFRENIIDKWKCTTVFDMSRKSDFGKWLYNNISNNERFPNTPFELDLKQYNFTRWYGIDYKTGVYTEKDMFLTDKMWYENPHFKLEEFITNGYQTNNLIFPNIFNFKFLYDDTPATPFQLNKYSLNRYFGFYCDFEKVKTVTPYRQASLISGLKIEKNIFMLENQSTGSTMPFNITIWDDTKNYYIFAIDNLYKVEKILDNGIYYYKIISDYDLSIDDINRYNEVDIEYTYDSVENYTNELIARIDPNFYIDEIITEEGIDSLYGDIYLININDKYHILEKVINDIGITKYYIRTDYAIKNDNNNLYYWIESNTSSYSETILIEDKINNEKPIIFDIYRIKFYDVKDFDFNRADTHFADFDLNQTNTYVETPEHKLYVVERRDASLDDVFKVYDQATVNADKIIIASSEYVSTEELYEITKYGLSNIWDKNQYVCKWGYVGSNSHCDYPYKLNNSKKVGSDFNRTTNPFSLEPNIYDKTHSFFYRLGEFYTTDTDGSTTYFTNNYYYTQTLSIETETMNDDSLKFNLDYYLKSDIDYFDYFFNNVRYFDSNLNKEQTQHYSIFNNGTKYNPSSTLFKGIKYNIYSIKDIIRNSSAINISDNKIKKILSNKEINFNNYKFSVIANIHNNNDLNNITSSIITLSNNKIHIFLNEKYKNILVIINIIGNFDTNILNLNQLNYFSEIDSLYTGKDVSGVTEYYNAKLLTAQNFITSLNNLNDKGLFDEYINYYYIDANAQSGYTSINSSSTSVTSDVSGLGTLRSVSSWGKEYPPFILDCEFPNEMKIKKNSFTYAAIRGPKYNIYDKYKSDYDEIVYEASFIKEPLARYISANEEEIKPRPVEHGESLKYDKTIYRFFGPYEPIFKTVELFKNSDYYIVNGAFFEQQKCGGYYDETISSLQGDLASLTQEQLTILLNYATNQVEYYTNILEDIDLEMEDINDKIYYYSNVLIDDEYVDKLTADLAYYQNRYNKNQSSLTYWTNKKSEYVDALGKIDSEIPTGLTSSIWIFKDRALGLCNNNYASCEVLMDTTSILLSGYTNILIISKFDLAVPPNSTINGITVNIKKYSQLNNNYVWSEDYDVSLVKPDGTKSDNKAKLFEKWGTTTSTYTYGSSSDLWGFTGTSAIEYDELNSDAFALSIQTLVYRTGIYTILNTVYIDCVCITVDYTIDNITTGYTYSSNFSRNLKFDTDLYNFGKTEEIIYSKVNDEENILKIKQTEEDKSIYPMIDEWGGSYVERFIFKSSWDSDYYIKTTNEIE